MRCPFFKRSGSVGVQVLFISVSFSIILIVYWHNVGGFNLLPGHKQCCPLSVSCLNPPPQPRANFQLTITSTTSETKIIPESRGDATVEQSKEEEDKKGTGEWRETRWGKEMRGDLTWPYDIEQEERKQRIVDVCSGKDAVEFPGRTQTFQQIPKVEFNHLIVDNIHQIIYCYVPKVGCSNWMKVMVALSGTRSSPSKRKPKHHTPWFLTLDMFMKPNGSNHYMMPPKYQHYSKFLFVRDPFVRLMSAYRDKFESVDEKIYQAHGKRMLSRYGNVSGSLPKSAAEAHAAGIRPSFEQFIKYLVDPETEKEESYDHHWRQVHHLCHPCQIKYDFIGNLETLNSDVDKLLRLLKVDHLVHYPAGNLNQTSAKWGRDWFAFIPPKTRRILYKIYEADFKLFGYPIPDFIN